MRAHGLVKEWCKERSSELREAWAAATSGRTAMGSSTPVILKVSTPEFKKVVIEASDGKRYYSDLSFFSKVYCFPKTADEWSKVAQDSGGYALVWTSRFEAHIDQIIGLATKVEEASKSA